jgi:hypothetical protein
MVLWRLRKRSQVCRNQQIIHFYPFLSIFIHFYPFFIHLYPSLSIFIHFYPFLSIFIHFYPFFLELRGSFSTAAVELKLPRGKVAGTAQTEN